MASRKRQGSPRTASVSRKAANESFDAFLTPGGLNSSREDLVESADDSPEQRTSRARQRKLLADNDARSSPRNSPRRPKPDVSFQYEPESACLLGDREEVEVSFESGKRRAAAPPPGWNVGGPVGTPKTHVPYEEGFHTRPPTSAR